MKKLVVALMIGVAGLTTSIWSDVRVSVQEVPAYVAFDITCGSPGDPIARRSWQIPLRTGPNIIDPDASCRDGSYSFWRGDIKVGFSTVRTISVEEYARKDREINLRLDCRNLDSAAFANSDANYDLTGQAEILRRGCVVTEE